MYNRVRLSAAHAKHSGEKSKNRTPLAKMTALLGNCQF